MNENIFSETKRSVCEEMTLLTDSEIAVSDNPGMVKRKRSSAKPKHRRTDEEKLSALMEQQKKLSEARDEHKKKGDKLDDQALKVSEQIREIHLRELEAIRKARGFEYADIVALLKNIPDAPSLKKLIADTAA